MGDKCCWGAGGAGGTCCQDIAGGQYGAVGSEHSHTVAGVVDAGSDGAAVLCFRL